ncbi:TetR family transcriptional regulator [Rhodococcus hoagii]|nr:TetR family transcriptional regulator [Prescottella equi]
MLVEDGYEALTFAAVARRAGVGRPLLYQWWGTMARWCRRCCSGANRCRRGPSLRRVLRGDLHGDGSRHGVAATAARVPARDAGD